jgi:hypothetical protein
LGSFFGGWFQISNLNFSWVMDLLSALIKVVSLDGHILLALGSLVVILMHYFV